MGVTNLADDATISFSFANDLVARRLGLSRGAAQAKLRELCASGVVRSWKEPYSNSTDNFLKTGEWIQVEGPEERIEPSEWRSHEIDLRTDAHGCRYFVAVSKDDLAHWLDRQEGPDQQEPKKRAQWLREHAKRAVNALWPKGPPANLNNAQIVNEVGSWLDRDCKDQNVSKLNISPDTILRAAGRKQ